MNHEKLFDVCYVLHGCPPTEAMVTPNEKRWMNWLSDKLVKRGFKAIAPDMPISWEPKYTEWKKTFEQYPVSPETYIVAHSCGGAFITRWLLETGKKVKKLILVAPAKIPETETDSRRDLYNFELPKATSNIADEIVLFSSNDFPHHLQSRELYIQAFHPREVKLENKGHFLFYQMGTNEFPELLQEVINPKF